MAGAYINVRVRKPKTGQAAREAESDHSRCEQAWHYNWKEVSEMADSFSQVGSWRFMGPSHTLVGLWCKGFVRILSSEWSSTSRPPEAMFGGS